MLCRMGAGGGTWCTVRMPLQEAIASTTQPAVTRLTAASNNRSAEPSSQPASWKAWGSASAPVPTIRLKM